jgi:hypothetical protein
MHYTVNQTVVIYNFTKVKILLKKIKMNEKKVVYLKKMSIFEKYILLLLKNK